MGGNALASFGASRCTRNVAFEMLESFQAKFSQITSGLEITPRVEPIEAYRQKPDFGDLDLLVDAVPGATLLDLGDLEEELKSLLGVDVDLLTPGDLPPKFRAKVLSEAQPV